MTRILLVEDEADQRENLQMILQKAFADYKIIAAGSLTEAVKKLQELRSVSLVVADYRLPDGTGYDLLQYSQEHLPNVPVIIVTAHRDSNEVRPAVSLRRGAFEFIDKPIKDYEELIERIKQAIQFAEALA
jgi:two-component system response regulator HydG